MTQIVNFLLMFFATKVVLSDPLSILALFKELIHPLSLHNGWPSVCKHALSPLATKLLVAFEDSLLSCQKTDTMAFTDAFIDEIRYKLLLLLNAGQEINHLN